MLENTIKIIGDNKPIIHSDRGFHYRVDSWIDLMNSNDFIRSMNKKGCSPDNSMCEGFFGTLKNEFFYGKDWSGYTRDELVIELNKYLDWFMNKRIKNSLNFKTPKEYNDPYKKSK